MTVRETISLQNPQALFYDERYDGALIGWTLGFGTKSDTRAVAVYDHDQLLRILAADFAVDAEGDGEDYDESELLSEAQQWIDYNMAGAYFGSDAPVIVTRAEAALASDSELCLVPDCESAGAHHAPAGSKSQRLCCGHYEQFIAHLLDPVRNPVFPISSK